MLIAGAAAGAGATRLFDKRQPQAVMLLQPAAINTLRDGTPVAIKGKVASTFGDAFLVEDGTGRTLVDTGPRGEGRTVVAPDETVTVQGRFDRGRLHAQVLVHADGRAEGFGPEKAPKPRRGPDGGPGEPGPNRAVPPMPDASSPRNAP